MTNRPAPARAKDSRHDAIQPGGAPHRLLGRLQPIFEDLGLNGYQARVLLALLQAGSATGIELARLSGVPRTSVYPVLHELKAQGLVTQVQGKSSVWISPGEEKVLDRLHAEQRERFETLETRVGQARELLAEFAVPPEPGSLPYVHVLHRATESRLAFEQNIAAARSELLMFTRPPASIPEDEPSAIVLDLLGRGVPTRVLYQASDIAHPPNRRWLEPLARYHEAGVEGRVVPDLPMKLAVFDREVALLALSDPVPAAVGFPTSLLVEHPGFATLQARAFDDLWVKAQPFDAFLAEASGRPATGVPGRGRRSKPRPARRLTDR